MMGLAIADGRLLAGRRRCFLGWTGVAGCRPLLVLALALILVAGQPASADQDAKRLYEDLLTDYNRLIRPVGNNSDRLTVKLGLKLSQLIDVVSDPIHFSNSIPHVRLPSTIGHIRSDFQFY